MNIFLRKWLKAKHKHTHTQTPQTGISARHRAKCPGTGNRNKSGTARHRAQGTRHPVPAAYQHKHRLTGTNAAQTHAQTNRHRHTDAQQTEIYYHEHRSEHMARLVVLRTAYQGMNTGYSMSRMRYSSNPSTGLVGIPWGYAKRVKMIFPSCLKLKSNETYLTTL